MKKFNIVIQCIARGEELYLKEWIEYHLGLGIEHIYLYDNNDDTTTLPIFLDAELNETDRAKVTVTDWNRRHRYPQNTAYRHFAKNYGNLTDWVLSIDIDEFLILEKPLTEFLQEFDYASQVWLSWKNFGADGKLTYSPEPVTQRFQNEVELSDLVQGKVIVRPDKVSVYGIHSCGLKDKSAITVNVNHQKIEQTPILHPQPPIYAGAWINHYFTKSLEEWESKIKRGCADDRFCRRYEAFFEINPDLAEHKDPNFQAVQNPPIVRPTYFERKIFSNWSEEQKTEYEKGKLRQRREAECFSVINRGEPWYDELTNLQKIELKNWYLAWLNVTDTMIIPKPPEWLK